MPLALARGLDRGRYQVHVWFLDEGGPLVEILEAAGAKVRVVKWIGGRNDLAGAWRFWAALKHHQIDLVHQHGGGRSIRWIARRFAYLKVIFHRGSCTSDDDGAQPVVARVFDADCVIACSHAVARLTVAEPPLRVIYPGVSVQNSVSTREHRRSSPLVIGTACRLVPIKGLVHLVRAMALLRKQMSEISLEIAGAGPERHALEAEVRLLDLTDGVTFLGWQDDLVSTMARWDVYSQPSLGEGFGIAALEAMASGLPVVASAVGGL
ncbi:MAG: glycosyltransferase, partial [Ignavibacteriales bacterium]|nr:glycosyltransferase [Ignavibacteriales bacterium]